MPSRIGPLTIDVEAERIWERIGPNGHEARYRLYIPSDMEKELGSLRELCSSQGNGILMALLAGDLFFATDIAYEELGRAGDRRVVELDALWLGTPGSHYLAYDVELEALENDWGI